VAMARALVACRWDMAKQVPGAPSEAPAVVWTDAGTRVPQARGRGTAPVWYHPQRREEAHG
jgi:hypothetical protein